MDNFFRLTKLDELPSTFKAVLYLLAIPLAIIILNEDFTKFNISPHFSTLMLFIFLIVYSLLVGFKDLKPFFKRRSFKENTKQTIYLAAFSTIFTVVAMFVIKSIIGVEDVQGLKDVSYSNEYYLKYMSILPFVAVGEEMFKAIIFLGFLSLVQGNWKVKLTTAILLASFMFGFMHGFDHKFTAGLPLMFGAIPTFAFLLYYRNIYPLIIFHFIFDAMHFSANHEVYGELFNALWMLGVFVVVIINMFRGGKKRTV